MAGRGVTLMGRRANLTTLTPSRALEILTLLQSAPVERDRLSPLYISPGGASESPRAWASKATIGSGKSCCGLESDHVGLH